jgi:hypothetical protein
LSIFATKIGHPEKGGKKGEKKGKGERPPGLKNQRVKQREISLSLSTFFSFFFLVFLVGGGGVSKRRCIPTTEMRECIRCNCVCRCPTSERARERERRGGGRGAAAWMNRKHNREHFFG